MGVQISDIVPAKEIELSDLETKRIALDAFNVLYQFLSIIRDRMTGEPLKDSRGRITSHLSGLFYRTSNLVEFGIKPVFVFDGDPPKFKKKTIEQREEIKKEARERWEQAVRRGEEAIKYAQAASRLTDEMVESSKKLLEYMGIPFIQAPSEGEAQCAHMAKIKEVFAAASQDFDSLLFGSPKHLRNISISGKRKVPKKEVYIEVKPEIIDLKEALETLGLNQRQLILLGMVVGTDYNPGGIKGYGAKKALELVKKERTLKSVLSKVNWNFETDAEEIFEFFQNPPVIEKTKLEWKEPDPDKIRKFMVDEHDFSAERVEKVIEKLQQSFTEGRQSSLKGWLEK